MAEEIYQVAGVWASGATGNAKPQWVEIREVGKTHIGLNKSYETAQMTALEARHLASELRRLADRVDRRNGVDLTMRDLGAAGGKARAEALPPERRSEIARAAANKRWSKK